MTSRITKRRLADVAVVFGCLVIGAGLALAVPEFSVVDSAERALWRMRFSFTDCGKGPHGCVAIPEAYPEQPISARCNRTRAVANGLSLAVILQLAYILSRKAPVAR